MVAITVILAAVIGTFVLGIGEDAAADAPGASFTCSPDGYITHTNGDPIPVDELQNIDERQIDGDEMKAGDGVAATEIIWRDGPDSAILFECPSYADDLVYYWSLDDVDSGTAYDSIGGIDGTLDGSISKTDGKVRDAAAFDGSSHIDTSQQPSDLGLAGDTPRTAAVWVYTDSFNEGGVFEMGNEDDGEEFGLRTDPNKIQTNNRWKAQFWSPEDIVFTYDSLQKWVHFVIVWDGTETRIYADGEQIASKDNDLDTTDSKTLKIGKWRNEEFEGKIDDLRIYDRALSEEEIEDLYDRTS